MTSFIITLAYYSTTFTLALPLLFLPHTTASTTAYFLDAANKPVVNGGSYKMDHFMPLPDEGPITWAGSNNSHGLCPLYVILHHYPMTSTHTNTYTPNCYTSPSNTSIIIRSPLKSKHIPLGGKVDLYFSSRTVTPCKKTLKWSIKSAKKSGVNAYYLVAGDVKRRDKGSFRVVKDKYGGSDYDVNKLVYCFNDKKCLDVGNSEGFLNRDILGISTDPMIKKKFNVLHITVYKD